MKIYFGVFLYSKHVELWHVKVMVRKSL